jgi:DNA-binding winged helix-turn-helix (wHTH) protein/Flp pilus assembly protein TadD
MPMSGSNVFRFGVFELDVSSGELRRHGLKIRLPDQSFQILKLLLSRPGDVITRDELRRALWSSETFVGFDVGMNSAVRKLREALDDSAENPRFVETLPRRGYRFIAPLATAVVAEAPVQLPSRPPRRLRLPSWRVAGVAFVLFAAAVLAAYAGGFKLPLRQQIAPEIADAAGRRPVRSAAAHAPLAYEAYLKGLTARGELRPDAFHRAVGYFEQAIAIEPAFADAYAELAFTQLQFLFAGPFSPHEIAPKAEAAARKALALDDTLFQAHRTLAQIYTLYHWQWEQGAEELRRAQELGNGRQSVGAALNDSLVREGRFAEAIARAERARDRDPLSVNTQVQVGSAYRAAGQFERSVAELQRALKMSPGDNRVQSQLGATFVAMGRLDDAIRAFEIAARPAHGHNSRMEAYLGYAYAAAGRSADARSVLKELDAHRTDQYVSWFGVALIHDALGETEPAIAALQRAGDDHAVEFAMNAQYPPFKTIANDPRFDSVMRKVGLPR